MKKIKNRILIEIIIEVLEKYKIDLEAPQKKEIDITIKEINKFKNEVNIKDYKYINRSIYYLYKYKEDLKKDNIQAKKNLISGSLDPDLYRLKNNYNNYYIEQITKIIKKIKELI